MGVLVTDGTEETEGTEFTNGENGDETEKNEGSQRRPKAGVRMTDVPAGASRPIHDRLVPTGTPVIPPALRAVRPRSSDDPTNPESNVFSVSPPLTPFLRL